MKDKNKKKIGRPPKRFCLRGHDTQKCGRDKYHMCRECKKGKYKKYKRKYKKHYIKNTKRILKYHEVYYEINKEHILKTRKGDPQLKKYNRKYRKKHKKQLKKREAKYRKNHKSLYRLAALRQHKKRKLRIPKWGQEGIKEFYENCPVGKVVDHVIPLQGELVSGLHVRWNLQYLTKKQNERKNNKFDGTLKNNGWRNKK